MVTVLAFLTGLIAILALISSAIRAALSWIPPFGWLIILSVIFGWYLGSSGGCNLGCARRNVIPPVPKVLPLPRPRPRIRDDGPGSFVPISEEIPCSRQC